jgi:hypothetical protein
MRIVPPIKNASVCQYQGLVLKTISMKIMPEVTMAQPMINASANKGIKAKNVRI